MNLLHKKRNLLFFMLLIFVSSSYAQTTFKFGGYAKFDNVFTKYNNGKPASSLIGDFHVPSLIPVGDNTAYIDNEFHVKESRFNFDVSRKINDKPVRVFMEFDFMLSPGGNERVSNSYSPRIRHFYFDYNGLLFGQTWSTFMIVVLPSDLDFVGAAEGVVFVRQPQVRYTIKGDKGNWQFAIENPEYTITPTPNGGDRESVSGLMPDVVVRKNFHGNWGVFSVAAMARGISYFDENDSRKMIRGFAMTTGGRFKVGERDDVKFTLTAGSGLGRYVGLNFLNAAMLNDDNSATTINSVNGSLAYLLHWNDKFKSSFNASALFGDNKGAASDALINKNAQSYSANILYTPDSKVLFGLEYMYATRELQDGTDGSMHRLQFSAKYVFGFSHTSKSKK